MIKYVFFDFNGTILDDVSLCLDLLNQILIKQGKDKITLTKYKKIFTFPIKKYYELAGIDFNKDSFEDLSKWFIKEYQPKSFKCSCYPNLQETLKKLNEKGIICGVLSASEIKNLTEQLEELNLKDDFAFILGLNDIYARSKVEVARKFINDNHIDPTSCLMIGDTTHDYLVSKELNMKSILFSKGHQDISILKECNVPIINDLEEILKYL